MIPTLLLFLFVFGALIFVHELGHYVVARASGVRVLIFSVGFGPRLLGVRHGGTDFRLSAIPLGGYVRMAGQDPRLDARGGPDEFRSKSRWQQCQILVAGPLMNVALTGAIVLVILLRGVETPAYRRGPPIIGEVRAGAPAAGVLRAGDHVLRVSGTVTPTWASLEQTIATHASGSVSFLVRRNEQTMAFTVAVAPGTTPGAEQIGLMPGVHPVIQAIVPGGPADRAGLQPDDVVVAVNARPVALPAELRRLAAEHKGGTLQIAVRRDAAEHVVAMRLGREEAADAIGATLGVPTIQLRPGLRDAVPLALRATGRMTLAMLRAFWGLVSGGASLLDLRGPVGIASMVRDAARTGLDAFLALTAVLSLNFGLVNLLPIPLLDGGHIAILALEGLRRRDVTLRTRLRLLGAGLGVLLLLIAGALYSDVMRLESPFGEESSGARIRTAARNVTR